MAKTPLNIADRVHEPWHESEFDDCMVTDVREMIWAEILSGITCPCCAQLAKMYRRLLYNGEVAQLYLGWIKHGHDWFPLQEHLVYCIALGVGGRGPRAKKASKVQANGDAAKMRHWGILDKEYAPSKTGSGKMVRTGRYRVSELGAIFLEEGVQIPRYCYTYNDECYGFSDEQTDFEQALGDKFDLDQLWSVGDPRPELIRSPLAGPRP